MTVGPTNQQSNETYVCMNQKSVIIDSIIQDEEHMKDFHLISDNQRKMEYSKSPVIKNLVNNGVKCNHLELSPNCVIQPVYHTTSAGLLCCQCFFHKRNSTTPFHKPNNILLLIQFCF